MLRNRIPQKRLWRTKGIAPGLLSPSLAHPAAEQVYLDVTQGNRVFSGLYDESLPRLRIDHGTVARWPEVVRRARSAPAEIVPGLLATALAERGIAIRASPGLAAAAVIAADERGRVRPASRGACVARTCPAGTTVVPARLSDLPRMIGALRGRDMLIALQRPRRQAGPLLAVGIAGRGFAGNLTSDSTRLGGVVLATDLAATILTRLGAPVPGQMLGRRIRGEGGASAADLASLQQRLVRVAPRRGPVIGVSLLVWVALGALAAALLRARGARTALELLAVCAAYMPALLLIGAAIEPSRSVERLIVLAGAPALALVTWWAVRGYAALAVACGTTVLAYAADMVAGSKLTPLSLMGPNPAFGVRFYGIGNELEATLAVLVPIGAGAALAAWSDRGERLGDRAAAIAFVAISVGAAAFFALGRFGADVGAAIVLPAGGAAAALAVLRERPRRAWVLALAAPFLGVAALALLDVLSGGNSHLTRSVLQAGGLHDVADVADRRLRSSANSFLNPRNPFLLALAVGAIAAAIALRRRIRELFEGRPAALAGLIGAAVATLVGALANDSGALFLTIGTGYLAAYLGFAWALGRPRQATTPAPGGPGRNRSPAAG